MPFIDDLANACGIDNNQVYFLVCQSIAICSGLILRTLLPPERVSPKLRHWFELLIGLTVLYIGYGPLILHLLCQAIPVYLMLVFLPPSIAQYGILIFSLAYLSAVHIFQLFTDNYGSLDISAPLMVQTQKLSSLAFNYNDGIQAKAGRDYIRDYHELNAIDRRPKLLQLGGYLFCFHNCMIGPFMFFADYLRFIEGREADRLTDPELRNRFLTEKDELRKARTELWKQLRLLLIHTVLFLWAISHFKADQFLSEDFARKNLLQKYLFMTVACFGFRQKFYFAWTTSCIASLAAGFGFSGFDSNGKPEYRFATNIHFLDIELGTSSKSILDSWNTATTRWLRECVYDRVPKQYAVWAVFVASAIWHGFHPGFYLAFVSAAVVTVTGRVCRRHLRPHFQTSPASRLFYDVLTHLGAIYCMNYLGVAFLLQKTNRVLFFWKQMRFLGHIVPVLILLSFPMVFGKPGDKVVRLNNAEQTPFENVDPTEHVTHHE